MDANPPYGSPTPEERLAVFCEMLEAYPAGRWTEAEASPRVLGTLFAPILALPDDLDAGRVALQERLLDLTLRRVKERVPYYRGSWPDRDSRWTFEALADLPLIDRRIVQARRTELIDRTTEFAFVSFTSGSTTGEPLMTERSTEEQSFLNAFFERVLEIHPAMDVGQGALGVHLGALNHGHRLQLRLGGYSYLVSQETESGYRKAAWLLTHEHDLQGLPPRVGRISGSSAALLGLVRVMRSEGLSVPYGQVKIVEGYGSYLPRRHREEIETFFGTPIREVYSMSELILMAQLRQELGGFVFDPYGSIVELIDPDTQRPIMDGVGEIVATSLFPFVQRFPLIRYQTGDLALCSRRASGAPTYRILGRKLYSARVGRSWLGSAQVLEVLDGIPDVARGPLGPFEVDAGLAQFELKEEDDGTPRLSIALRYDPRWYRERVLELEAEVRRALLAIALPEAREALARTPSLLRVHFEGPCARATKARESV